MKKIMTVIGCTMIALFISGCEKTVKENTADYILPAGLEDCKIFKLYAGKIGTDLTVVRCPLSSTSTTYKSGKTTKNVTITEGSMENNTEKNQKDLK